MIVVERKALECYVGMDRADGAAVDGVSRLRRRHSRSGSNRHVGASIVLNGMTGKGWKVVKVSCNQNNIYAIIANFFIRFSSFFFLVFVSFRSFVLS